MKRHPIALVVIDPQVELQLHQNRVGGNNDPLRVSCSSQEPGSQQERGNPCSWGPGTEARLVLSCM
jgi:hypothetical protein